MARIYIGRRAGMGVLRRMNSQCSPFGSLHRSSSSWSEPFTRGEPVNWKERGVLTPVRDQYHFSICWSFATCGVLEPIHYMRTKEKIIVSPMDLVYEMKSSNGSLDGVHEHICMHGVALEDDCPYLRPFIDKKCKTRRIFADGYRVVVGQENIQKMLEKHPLACTMHVPKSLYRYKEGSGVYQGDLVEKGPHNAHGIVIVGWGISETEGEYWLCKNSWGPKWGYSGYFMIKRDPSGLEPGLLGRSCWFPVYVSSPSLSSNEFINDIAEIYGDNGEGDLYVRDTDDGFYVRQDIQGLQENDIVVYGDVNKLRMVDLVEGNATFLRLPPTCDSHRLKTYFKDGVFQVLVPKGISRASNLFKDFKEYLGL